MAAAVALITPLLDGAGGLSQRIAVLENELTGKDRDAVSAVVASHGLAPATLAAPLLVRELLGKLSDLIHATGIALAPPHVLEPGEHVRVIDLEQAVPTVFG